MTIANPTQPLPIGPDYLHELLVIHPANSVSTGTINTPLFTFDSRYLAEEAIHRLNKAGFDIKKLSLIGKGYHSEEHALGFYTAGDRIKAWVQLARFGAASGDCYWPQRYSFCLASAW